MSNMHGSLPNTTTGLLLMEEPQDLDRTTESHNNVVPRGKQADPIKTMDLAGLMVCNPAIAEMAVMSNSTRGVAHSQRQHKERLPGDTINGQ